MLDLGIYSGKEIQNSLNFLIKVSKIRKDITVNEAIGILNKEIFEMFKETKKANQKLEYTQRIKKIKCPSCKKGYLWPTPNYEDLNILSCKKCRYSTILEEEIENG